MQPGQPCAAQRTVTSPPAWPAARRPRGSRRRGQEWPHARGGRAVTPSPSGRPRGFPGDRVADASPPHVCVRDGVMEANTTATRVAHDSRASTCDVCAAPTLLGGSVQQSARTRMQTCTHADMHTCRRAHAGVRTRRHVHTQMCTHMQTCAHADMCTRAHAHMHTQTRGPPGSVRALAAPAGTALSPFTANSESRSRSGLRGGPRAALPPCLLPR